MFIKHRHFIGSSNLFYDIKNGMMPTGKSILIRSVKGAILMTGTNKSLHLKVVQLERQPVIWFLCCCHCTS